MLKISTSSSASLILTASHVVFRLSNVGALESTYASQMVKGDRLVRLEKDGGLESDEVVEIQTVLEDGGFWAPLTREGSLLVNGFLVSSFASFPHHLSQQAFAVVKAFPKLLLDDELSQHEDGERQVVTVMKKMGELYGLRGWIQPPTEMEKSLSVKVSVLRQSLSAAHHSEL